MTQKGTNTKQNLSAFNIFFLELRTTEGNSTHSSYLILLYTKSIVLKSWLSVQLDIYVKFNLILKERGLKVIWKVFKKLNPALFLNIFMDLWLQSVENYIQLTENDDDCSKQAPKTPKIFQITLSVCS